MCSGQMCLDIVEHVSDISDVYGCVLICRVKCVFDIVEHVSDSSDTDVSWYVNQMCLDFT